MKILVTGASGFIGSGLARRLLSNKNIALSVLTQNNNLWAGDARVRSYTGDITKPESLRECMKDQEVIIHCAALMSNFDNEPRHKFYEVNAAGTENVLKACDRKTIKQFIHMSTCGVMGDCGKTPSDEASSPRGVLSSYEWSKAIAENKVISYSSENNIPYTILRPSQMYGRGMTYGWTDIIAKIKNGRMFVIGGGRAKIHLLHIDDLVDAVFRCLAEPKALGKTFIIAGPETVSLVDVFSLIARILAVKRPAHLPYFPIYSLSSLTQFLPAALKKGGLALLTPHRVRFFASDHHYNIAKAKREISYEPKISLNEGFADMVKWCIEKEPV